MAWARSYEDIIQCKRRMIQAATYKNERWQARNLAFLDTIINRLTKLAFITLILSRVALAVSTE